MKISSSQIKAITLGAERVEEIDNKVSFHRFTQAQEEFYKNRNSSYHMQSLATAGIKLSFLTDSCNLTLKGSAHQGTSRLFYSIDVFVNHQMIDCIDNFSEDCMKGNYIATRCPLGDFSKDFDLGCGEKEVTVYLPWSVRIELDDFIIDDNSFIEPVKCCKKLLAFGDSITQGYDALRPSNRYMSLLAEKIGAEEINKAIGGEVFVPDLAQTEESFTPDYITVAYGTNDWVLKDKSDFKKDCREFYEALSKKYPASKIFAITPLWRKDCTEQSKVCSFGYVEEYIKEVTSDLDNVVCISGFDFVPHDETYYADLRLHPNDKGFKKQFEGLYKRIEKHL